MSVWGVTMVRDEADVIEGVIRHMAGEVDGIVAADNLSVDATRKILDQLANEVEVPLVVLDDFDPGYQQSHKMTHLARLAACEFGATWIVPFDADELWVAPDRLSSVLPGIDGTVVLGSLFNHFATAVDPAGDDPFRTIVWRQADPAPLPKVAFRWHPDAFIHQGNHGVDLPDYRPVDVDLEIRHFPYRSAEQMVRKARNGAAAYAATNLPEHQGAHWRAYGDLIERHGEEALHDVYRTYFWHLSPVDAGLVHDPAAYRRWEP